MAEAATQEPAEEVAETADAPKSISVLDKLFTVNRGQLTADQAEVAPQEDAKIVEQVNPAETKIVAKTEPAPNLSPKARENFAKLEEAKKAAETERDRLKTEFEATQTKLKEYEEKLKTAPNPEEFTAKERQYQEQLQTLQNELKFAALERDPDFVAKFETPRAALQQTLQDMALSTGASQEDFQRAVKLGLSDRLDEIRESLPSHAQRRWDAALTQIESVQLQKELALKDRDRTYEEILQQRNQHWQQEASKNANQLLQQNINLAHRLADEPFEKIEALKDNEELRQEVRSTLEAIAGGKGADKWNAEQLMREFAASVVQRHILQTQHQLIEGTQKELADTKAQLEEAKKALEERESFIQKRYGSVPKNTPSSNGSSDKAEDDTAIWKRIRVVTR